MNKVALKIAVSPLIVGLTMVGCTTGPSTMPRSMVASAPAGTAAQKAARHYLLAEQYGAKGDMAKALLEAEKAVELAPRDAGYRLMMADFYLKNGRFLSAESAFADVLTLNPESNRARFNLALVNIALGKQYAALVQLDRLAEAVPHADLGLAYALAGQPQRAVTMLEPAARMPGADGRVRQNLALAHALSGDWERARIVASQDLNAVDLAARMEQWAGLAQPGDPRMQVASLLNVAPVEDSGQPARLALAQPEPASVTYAEAQPVPPVTATRAIHAEAPPVEPQPIEAPAVEAPAPAPEPVEEAVRYATAARSLIATQPAVVRSSAPALPAPVATAFKAAAARPSVSSRFVVQLGAYSSVSGVERGWAVVEKRYGLDEYAPLSATVNLPGKGTIHRLSVSGFDSRSEAIDTCRSIKAKGGACFVRANSGDRPVRWASRDNRNG